MIAILYVVFLIIILASFSSWHHGSAPFDGWLTVFAVLCCFKIIYPLLDLSHTYIFYFSQYFNHDSTITNRMLHHIIAMMKNRHMMNLMPHIIAMMKNRLQKEEVSLADCTMMIHAVRGFYYKQHYVI